VKARGLQRGRALAIPLAIPPAIPLAIALVAAAATLPAAAQRVTVADVTAAPGLDVVGFGLNQRGQVVGRINDPVSGATQGYVWSEGGGLVPLGTDPGYATAATRINDRGELIGVRNLLTAPYTSTPFLRGTDGVVRALPGMDSAVAINASGAVLGMQGIYAVVHSGGVTRGVLSAPYGGLGVAALADNGRIAGTASFSATAPVEPFAFDPADGSVVRLLEGAGSTEYRYALAMSPDGRTLALNAAANSAADTHGHIWRDGVLTDLTPLLAAGQRSFANGVNDAGMVAGGLSASAAAVHATAWFGGRSLDMHAAAGLTSAGSAAVAVNAHGQVLVLHDRAGLNATSLVTLHPDWTGGDGDWASSARWNYAGLGAVAAGPAAVHDVVIRPAGSATVRGASLAEVRTLVVGGAVGDFVTLDLNGGTTRALQGPQLAGYGVLTGSGRLAGALVVDYGARIEVGAGQRMQLVGGHIDHAGALRVSGATAALEVGGGFTNRALGEVRITQGSATFAGAVTNEGRLIASGGELVFGAGLANGAELNLSFGATQVGGRIANAGSGRIVVSNGALATFSGDVDNAGELRVSAGGAANFFGRVQGGGRITGTGQARFEGGLVLAAASAVSLQVDPLSTLGSDALTLMGLAGTATGRHDHLAFTQAVALEGGTLQLLWLDGASGQAGDRWDLFDWNGGVSGRYAVLDLPALQAGLRWDTSALHGSGELAIAAVPEPAAWALWLCGLGAAALRRRFSVRPWRRRPASAPAPGRR